MPNGFGRSDPNLNAVGIRLNAGAIEWQLQVLDVATTRIVAAAQEGLPGAHDSGMKMPTTRMTGIIKMYGICMTNWSMR